MHKLYRWIFIQATKVNQRLEQSSDFSFSLVLWFTSLAAFPLPFKLRKLKLWIENTPNGNVSISQKLTFIAKKFLRSHEVVFRQFEKGIFRQKLQWKCFFAHLQVTWRMYCKKSYDHSSMYHNLQETLHTWPLSSIRGFPCH